MKEHDYKPKVLQGTKTGNNQRKKITSGAGNGKAQRRSRGSALGDPEIEQSRKLLKAEENKDCREE